MRSADKKHRKKERRISIMTLRRSVALMTDIRFAKDKIEFSSRRGK
jgi:hypothetical protein